MTTLFYCTLAQKLLEIVLTRDFLRKLHLEISHYLPLLYSAERQSDKLYHHNVIFGFKFKTQITLE